MKAHFVHRKQFHNHFIREFQQVHLPVLTCWVPIPSTSIMGITWGFSIIVIDISYTIKVPFPWVGVAPSALEVWLTAFDSKCSRSAI